MKTKEVTAFSADIPVLDAYRESSARLNRPLSHLINEAMRIAATAVDSEMTIATRWPAPESK